ncbi:DNA-binding protein [Rosenbergiella collisarenosi]|uniref:helix-turn-helix transcriptional regulator n=1 Tax=Rosenbergiella collisarenosi TaxID=1544695 RepID=UPI001BDB28F9|nr:DNA-binding protein [Rosenbergiella collisarenosi]MBT0720398.1 DNA-binding protein [Rosenbergiella collisarenosi]
MQQSDLMTQEEVFKLISKKRTALYRLRKKEGFPEPVLQYPSQYLRSDVDDWLSRNPNRFS